LVCAAAGASTAPERWLGQADALDPASATTASAAKVSARSSERTGLAIAKTVKQLRPLPSATIVINGATQTFPPEIPQAQREILTHLGFKPGY
jgi:hypothetical protein